MSDDWGKTTNLRSPKGKSEPDYGATVVNYRFQEEEAPRQTEQPPQQQQPPQKQGSGIPIWLWGILAGFAGLVFLVIAGVLLYFIFAASPGFTLIVEGAQPNSRVFVDGVERSTTSAKGNYIVHDLRAGRRNIRVTCDGYADYNGSVVGNDGDEKRLPVTMAKVGGSGNGNGNGNGNNNGNGNSNKQNAEDEIKKTGRVNLTINFKTGSAEILPVSFTPLDEIVSILKRNADWQIRVEGHTDNKGGVAYNQKLSELRAASVMKYFTDRGISSSRLTSKGFGLSSPIAGTVQNQTEDERTKNRRVTLVKTN